MAGTTKINWTRESWGIFRGCSRCAPECINCYAELLAGTKLKDTPAYRELTVIKGDGVPHWTGRVDFVEKLLTWPLTRKGTLIFTNSMSDPFHGNALEEWRDKFFAAMLLAPQHVFQVLTKRPGFMADYICDPETKGRVFQQAREIWAAKYPKGNKPFPEDRLQWPLPHVWLGTSVGSQKSADDYTEQLLRIPEGWLIWWSVEPLIGPIMPRAEWFNGSRGNKVGWVVVGGESGSADRARPMQEAWANTLRNFCAIYNTPYWYKQPGNWREMEEYDRMRYLNDRVLMEAAVVTGRVSALGEHGETIRGVKVATETMKNEKIPLFWYDGKKGGTGESPYRTFPAFPPGFVLPVEVGKEVTEIPAMV